LPNPRCAIAAQRIAQNRARLRRLSVGAVPAAIPAPGEPALASRAAELLRAAGFDVSFDENRGLDHGVWVPLRYLLPAARTPVFQVSLPVDLDGQGAIRLGQALAPLRGKECSSWAPAA